MILEQILVIALAAFLTSIVSSLAGFGGGIAMIVTFSFFFDVKTTIALSSIYFFVNNSNKCLLYRKTVDWPFLKFLLIGALPGVVIGLYCFYFLPEKPIKIFLGLLGFYLILEHFIHFLPKVKNFSPMRISIMGFVWGIVTGAANGMPIKVMLLKWRSLTKHKFVGTSAIMSFFVDLIKLVGYFCMGFLALSDFWLWGPLFLLVSIAGTWIGKYLLGKTSPKIFELIMLVLIFIGSVKLMFF